MTGPLLYSERSGAKLLGVSRDTLAALRLSGVLRTVSWPGRIGFRIPLDELQRIAREGVVLHSRGSRPSRQRIRANNPAAGIRAIRVEDL